MPIQYLTNERGETTGVLLDFATYHQIRLSAVDDPELLVGMSQAELEALAASQLAPNAQDQLEVLLTKQKAGTLSQEKSVELDSLLSQIDQLTILKTRARYTLNHLMAP